MSATLEIPFAPAEFAAQSQRDLSQTICVVFDVLRATSTIVTALANGASAVIPVAEIPEALAVRAKNPAVLLAGERNGLRIRADLTGGTDFDLGNSPREFTAEKVNGRAVVLTTTNGSRALRDFSRARTVLAASLLNLSATAEFLKTHPTPHLLFICSGTFSTIAYEDVLGAGALADLLWPTLADYDISDAARIAHQLYLRNRDNLPAAIQHSRNARRLAAIPELRDDVPFCLQRDRFPLIARLTGDSITAQSI